MNTLYQEKTKLPTVIITVGYVRDVKKELTWKGKETLSEATPGVMESLQRT